MNRYSICSHLLASYLNAGLKQLSEKNGYLLNNKSRQAIEVSDDKYFIINFNGGLTEYSLTKNKKNFIYLTYRILTVWLAKS